LYNIANIGSKYLKLSTKYVQIC